MSTIIKDSKVIADRSYETEQLGVLSIVLNRMTPTRLENVETLKDIMLCLRVDWEDLQSTLSNRKLDGYEPVIEKMLQLATTTLLMTSEITARYKNERLKQMYSAPEVEVEISVEKVEKVEKREKKEKKEKRGRRKKDVSLSSSR